MFSKFLFDCFAVANFYKVINSEYKFWRVQNFLFFETKILFNKPKRHSWAPELEVVACLNRGAFRTSHLRLLFRWIDYSTFFRVYLVLQIDDSD